MAKLAKSIISSASVIVLCIKVFFYISINNFGGGLNLVVPSAVVSGSNRFMRQFRTIDWCVLFSLLTYWFPQAVPVKQRRVRRPGRVESVRGFVLVLQHHRHRRRRGGRAGRQRAIGRDSPAGGPQTVGALRPEVRIVRAGRRY